MEFYRITSIGIALANSLNQMVVEGLINSSDAANIMRIFDENFGPSMEEVISKELVTPMSAKV